MVVERDPGTEKFLDTLENNHIYRDMREKFDEVTNDGDEYLDEHDEIVFKYAAEKYGISTEEANKLYQHFEMEMSKFFQRRLTGEE